MKFSKIVLISAFAFVSSGAWTYCYARGSSNASSPAAAESVSAFLGRWDLTLKAPDHEYPSWLEIRQEGGQIKAQMVSRWGSARPLPKVELANGHLTFVSPKEEEDSK